MHRADIDAGRMTEGELGRVGFVVVDSKGEAACVDLLWGTTREQVFDHENSIRDQWPMKTKELVSAEGIEPSTY